MLSTRGNKINEIVGKLVKNYHNANHKLYMDNFYCSMKVFDKCKEKNIYCSGTFRMNRGEPENFKIYKKTIKKNNIILK